MTLTADRIERFLKGREDTLLADLAIHFMADPEAVRAVVDALVQSGQIERLWQPRKTSGCKLCGCDSEEHLRWIGG